ncbi:hypothetical protein IMZ48_49450 [Candidatus Bathyarchaeota archaeon]|nr:hypothetical protein [Candidatus Bathyarchaeota archaeon]
MAQAQAPGDGSLPVHGSPAATDERLGKLRELMKERNVDVYGMAPGTNTVERFS